MPCRRSIASHESPDDPDDDPHEGDDPAELPAADLNEPRPKRVNRGGRMTEALAALRPNTSTSANR